MKKLIQLLNEFDGTQANSVKELSESFKMIAKRVLYGGHFEINDSTEIYPLNIEFYYFNENPDSPKELNDSRMYHKGKGVDYFPVLSFYPHESGVDVTFENDEKKYRASFLIRSYKYKYYDPDIDGIDDNPRHLWEDMFGYHSIGEDGIRIKWIDDTDFKAEEPDQDVRHHLHKDLNGVLVQDDKPWRFFKK